MSGEKLVVLSDDIRHRPRRAAGMVLALVAAAEKIDDDREVALAAGALAVWCEIVETPGDYDAAIEIARDLFRFLP